MTQDESLLDKVIHGTNDKRNDGKDTKHEGHHALMLRLYLGALGNYVRNPLGTDDDTSEDDDDDWEDDDYTPEDDDE